MLKIIIFLLIFSTNLFATITIKFSYVVNNDTPKGKAALMFKREIERVTKGNIKVDLYPNGTLFDDVSAIKAVQKNIIQMAAPSLSKFGGIIDDFQVFDIPYLFDNVNEIHLAYNGTLGQILKKQASEKKLIILDFWDNAFKSITNNIREIILPEDMQGVKFRTMGGNVIYKQFEIAGAKAYLYSFSNLKYAIVEGIIDGQENTFSNIYSKKIHLYQKYMTISNHAYLGYALIISKKFWDSLSKTNQNLIKNVVDKVTKFEIKYAKEENIDSFYKIKNEAENMRIIKLNSIQKRLWVEFYKKHYREFYEDISTEVLKEVQKLN